MNLAVFEFNGQAVRSTGDGRFSVFDVLMAFIDPTERKGKKAAAINPRQVFKSITERNPEVVQFCDNFKFPGRGQRETPVATEEGMYQVLMLCPGKRGAEFRRWASQVVRERIEESRDGELAYSRGRDRAIKVWRRNGLTDQDIQARLKGVEQRNHYTDTLKAHGVKGIGYAACTNAIYLELFDGDAKTLKASKGLAKSENLRDSFNRLESAGAYFAEVKSSHEIETQGVRGNQACADLSRRAARAVRKAMDA